ncbi:hypothetical protein N5K16_16010 [Serratia marcescens]|uniref:hypothetical protein n=1 Tax=Serratia marcescens TaxID=615 RepID=UPI00245135C9|nr:hypothetical protein [Serratia marcescens]MDH2256673.1 hypothetical protein [Serratia marcescens]
MPLRITPSVAEQEGQQTETEATGAPQKHHYTLNQQVGSITENLTLKYQASNKWLKPMVRVLKNLRSKLIADGKLKSGLAPSYYLEGLLYNVPNEKFGTSYADCFVNAMNWIQTEADKDKLVCANEQYYLLWEGTHTSWEKADAEAFIDAAIKMWNEW